MTSGIALDDDLHEKMIATAKTVTQEVCDDQTSLPVYALVAFDPRVPEASAVLEHVEELVEVHWPSLRNTMTDRPVALLRCVLVIGLLDACDKSTSVVGVLYLSLRDLLERLTEPNESDLRKDILSYLSSLHNAAALQAWREEIGFEPKPKVGKLQFSLPGTASKALTNHLEEAVNGEAVSSANASVTGDELLPEWRTSYANDTSAAITEVVNALGTEIAAKLPHQLRNAETYHEAISSILKDAVVIQREARLLWWLQAKYSTSLKTSYRNLNPFEGAFHMALDLNTLMPITVPAEVEAVLQEAVYTTYGAERAQEEKGLQETLELLVSLPTPTELGAPRQDKRAGRLPLLDVLRLVRSTQQEHPTSENWMGLPADTRVTPADLALWLFRNAQAEALLQ